MSLFYLNILLKSFALNNLPLLFRHPIQPIHNLIYLLIRYHNLALYLFAFCQGRKRGFLFVEVDILSTRETSLS